MSCPQADVSVRDAQGRLPIHYISLNEHGAAAAAAVPLLARAPGFDPDARLSRAETGDTVLHMAALRRTDDGEGTKAVIQALIAAGAGGQSEPWSTVTRVKQELETSRLVAP